MKKIIIIVCLMMSLGILVSCHHEEDYLRLRIIAESNSEKDLKNKSIIKESLKELFDESILNYQNITIDKLEESLCAKLNQTLYRNIKIEKCISHYPAKSYQGKMIPSGDYETILITIGAGKGSNFWTLLYPEYFGYEFEEDNEIEYRSYFYDLFN